MFLADLNTEPDRTGEVAARSIAAVVGAVWVQNGLPSARLTKKPEILNTEPDRTGEVAARSIATVVLGLGIIGT
ncbi:hypothetical protein T484DRAFT_1828207, partial [Baffinella frigidus]